MLVARSFKRQVSVKPLYSRPCYRMSGLSASCPSRSLRISVAGGGALTATLVLGLGYSLYAEAPMPSEERVPTPLSKFLTSYAVYSMCSVPGLVDSSPALLAFCTSVPGIRQLTEAFVRATFFKQFVGGDSAQECLPSIRRLRAENKGALLAYSVEADGNETADEARRRPGPLGETPHQRIVQEMIRAIELAASYEDSQRDNLSSGRRTWVAVKPSALLSNPAALVHLSAHLSSLHARDPTPFPGCPRADDLAVLNLTDLPPGSPLSAQDLSDLRELREGLIRICTRARGRNVRVIVDAEHSCYQPAIDSLSLALMREFNREPPSLTRWPWRIFSRTVQPGSPPLIYVTCQAYLRRTPEYLAQFLRDATSNHYALGIKLVRGAYHEQEVVLDSPSLPLSTHGSWPPVFTSKDDTDRCYDAAIVELVRAVANADGRGPRVGVLFASHNPGSCAKVLDALVSEGLATHEEDGTVRVNDLAAERVSLAQLYGMADTLSDRLATSIKTRAPFVMKYVPYGALREVMPYLSRRAFENKSILGNGHAAEERRQAFDALWKRLFGG